MIKAAVYILNPDNSITMLDTKLFLSPKKAEEWAREYAAENHRKGINYVIYRV